MRPWSCLWLSRSLPVLLLLGFLVPPASAAASAQLSDVWIERGTGTLAVRLRTRVPVGYRTLTLGSPVRVVVDMDDTRFAWRRGTLEELPAPIRDIRGSQWRPGVSRVVVELREPTPFRVEEAGDGLRVVLLEPPRVGKTKPEGDGAREAVAPPPPAVPAREPSDLSVRGRVEVGARSYYLERGGGLEDDSIALEGELDLTYRFSDAFRLRARPRLLIDPLEPSRNRYEPLDAYLEYRAPAWSLLLGQTVESWAIVDTFNPADVLNRRDVEWDLYDPPKLGEVMARLGLFLPDAGVLRQPAVSLYFLPLFREMPLPGKDDRFRFDVTGDDRGDLGDAERPSSEVAYAARLSASLGSADLFLFYFGGPTRLPAFALSAPGEVTPVYYRVDMVGGGLQWVLGPWVLKLETAYTFPHTWGLPRRLARAVPGDYFQYVVGLDRTFMDVLGKTELTVTLEYAGEDHTGPTTLDGLRPYRSDVFLGVRWQLNDPRRTELRGSLVADVLVDEQLWQLEVATTLWRDLRLVVGGQFVNRAPRGSDDDTTLYNLFPNNSNVRASLRYEF